MVSFRTTLAVAAMLTAPVVTAHLELTSPFPLHSKLDSKVPDSLKDYSMTSPLATDGSQYPCKGYIAAASDPLMAPVKTVAAGSSVNYQIGGTATHGGGSCQMSMSYDNGKSWNVIQSIMGGCMVEGQSLDVTIPSEAPSGDALFAWSWFNQLGNREMYQNCAVITVTNGGSGLTGPAPFVANVGVNDCHTIENVDVVFPNPGPNVVYGGKYASSKPTAPAGFTGSNCDGNGGSASAGNEAASGSSSSSSSSAPAAAAAASGSSTKSSSPAPAAATASAATPTVANNIQVPASSSTSTSTSATSTRPVSCRRRRRRSHPRDIYAAAAVAAQQ
jgi:hypothetical protein